MAQSSRSVSSRRRRNWDSDFRSCEASTAPPLYTLRRHPEAQALASPEGGGNGHGVRLILPGDRKRDGTSGRPWFVMANEGSKVLMHSIVLDHDTDFDAWRKAARRLAMAEVAPADVTWTVAGNEPELFPAS